MYAYIIEAARMSANIVAAINSLDPTLSSITFDASSGIKRNVDDGVVYEAGASSTINGAYAALYGGDHGGIAGYFITIGDKRTGVSLNSLFKIRYQADGALTDKVVIDKDGNITISGVYDDTVAGTANVIVSAGGHLQRATSNEKHKKNIKDLTVDTFKIYDLRPREFQWDHEIEELKEVSEGEEGEIKEGKVIRPKQTITKDHVGLIAEEAGEFATHNILTGEPDGIDWNSIVTALLTEVKKLRTEINELKQNRR